MARYDESYDGTYIGPRTGWWGGDNFPRNREFTPFPEQAPPSYSGGGAYDRGYGGFARGGYDRDLGDPRGPWRDARYGADLDRAGLERGYGGQRARFTAGPPRAPGNYGPYATPPRRPDELVGGRGGPRGEYGGAYEAYSRPGDGWQGGYGGRASQARGYDAGYAREPFMPDEAYRRHPEYRQQPHPREWEAHQHTYGLELSDEDVRSAVYRRMSADAWLDPAGIGVQVEDGVVTLTGEVDDFLKARYAWDDAWEAEGVRGVVNNLTVRADQPATPTHGDVLPQSGGERTNPDEAGTL